MITNPQRRYDVDLFPSHLTWPTFFQLLSVLRNIDIFMGGYNQDN